MSHASGLPPDLQIFAGGLPEPTYPETVGIEVGDLAAAKATPEVRVNLDAWGNADIVGSVASRQGYRYTFTAPIGGVLFVSPSLAAGSRLNAQVQLWSGSQYQGGNNDPSAPIGRGIDVRAGDVLRLDVAGRNGSTGGYRIELRTALARTDDVPNDFAHATALTLGGGEGYREGVIERAGDVDMFTFTAPMTGQLYVWQQPVSQSRVDPYLYAYDSGQNLLAGNNDSEGSLASRVVLNVAAGSRYYLKAAANGYSTGGYRLRLTTVTYPDDFGNTFETARPLNVADTGAAAMLGAIEWSGDVDMFRFAPTTGGQVTIKLSAMSGSSLDSYVYVYNSGGTLVAQNNNGPRGADSEVAFNAAAGATYYVKAANFNNTTGQYFLQVFTPAFRPTPPDDDFGNTFAAAKALTLSSEGRASILGSIEISTDVDMFRFVTTASGQLTIKQSALSGQPLDAFLSVYDASGVLVAQNNNGPRGTDSQVVMNIGVGATYYVKAAGSSSTAGRYLVEIQDVAAPRSTGNFQITLSISGLTVVQERLARDAAARWERAIVGDLPDVRVNGRLIDDVFITVTGKDIDGGGTNGRNILGQAAPTVVRTAGGLPCQGFVEIDKFDMVWMQDQGRLLDVFTHEIAHVLGLGQTVWQAKGLLAGANTLDPRFTGPRATAEYRAIFGNREAGVPVENYQAAAGTRLAHWRESVLTTELMTGGNDSGPNALSRITVASMADLGYQVNMAAAEPFSRPAARASAAKATPGQGMAETAFAASVSISGDGGRAPGADGEAVLTTSFDAAMGLGKDDAVGESHFTVSSAAHLTDHDAERMPNTRGTAIRSAAVDRALATETERGGSASPRARLLDTVENGLGLSGRSSRHSSLQRHASREASLQRHLDATLAVWSSAFDGSAA